MEVEIGRIRGNNPEMTDREVIAHASYNIANNTPSDSNEEKRQREPKPIIVCDCCGQSKKLAYLYKDILYLSLIYISTPHFAINGLCNECYEEEKRLRRDPNFRARLGQ